MYLKKVFIKEKNKAFFKNIPNVLHAWADRLMPYPCSQFYVDINFGNRLYSKDKRQYNLLPKLIST